MKVWLTEWNILTRVPGIEDKAEKLDKSVRDNGK
jgi:hypothetical protein